MILVSRRRRLIAAPRSLIASAVLVGGFITLQGCAAVGLTLLGVGAGTAAGTGTGHALDGITYKTFTVPLDGLAVATVMTLDRMDIRLTENQETETGRKIVGQAGERTIEIELDKLTSRATRMRVVAKMKWFLRDRATATEVILQTDRTLSDHPHLAGTEPPPQARAPRIKQR